MCGLVGIAGAINLDAERAFKDLLFLDVLRGKHSTGAASMYGTQGARSFRVFKEEGNAIEVMGKPGFTTLMTPKSRILMGHNRFATKGAINVANAHPFEFENVIGAHNGTLYSYWSMHNSKDFDVDSQALYSELNENGVDSMWGKLNGAAALTWIDKRTKTINMLRNKERPLYFVYANEGKTLLWASEDWMLYVAAGRNNIKLDSKPYELPINELYTFNVGEVDADKIELSRTAVKPYVYVAPKYSGYSSSTNGHGGYLEDPGKKHLTKEGITLGTEVEFEVSLIKDTFYNGQNRVNVYGTTLKGTPIRIWSLDDAKHSSVIDNMSILDGAVFTGIVKYTTEQGLTIGHDGLKFTGYTIEDILAAEEELKANKGKLAANKEKKGCVVVTSYNVSCSSCQTKMRKYNLVGEERLCDKCYKVH